MLQPVRRRAACASLYRGRDSTTCYPSCLDVFPTANRFHLSWVGSSIPARPRPTKDGRPYLVPEVGSGPRHDIGCFGPFAAGRSMVGARFIAHSAGRGRGEATPLPSAALRRPGSKERTRCHRVPTSRSGHKKAAQDARLERQSLRDVRLGSYFETRHPPESAYRRST